MSKPKTYAQAGVHLDAAETWVDFITQTGHQTSHDHTVTTPIGSFASACRIPKDFGRKPIVLTACDGVGTKLKYPVSSVQKLSVLGVDLVAMNVNDIAACGGTPVMFLDYLACGYLDVAKYRWILHGMRKALQACNTMLVGGETAEMPICYKRSEFDLAGFVVGFARPNQLLRPTTRIRTGDVLIGIPSNGVHSNGYSLIHKIFSQKILKKHESQLFRPTSLYAPLMTQLLRTQRHASAIVGAAHITGGGMPDNIARILPLPCSAYIHRTAWRIPSVFRMIQKQGRISDAEMFRTFNMGIGFVLVVRKTYANRLLSLCQQAWPKSSVIGHIGKRGDTPPVILG